VTNGGTPVPNMRVVTRAKLEKLNQAVVVYAVAIAEGQGRWDDEHAVSAHLAHGKLDAGNLFQTFAEAPRTTR
jgi:hypothetical protein